MISFDLEYMHLIWIDTIHNINTSNSIIAKTVRRRVSLLLFYTHQIIIMHTFRGAYGKQRVFQHFTIIATHSLLGFILFVLFKLFCHGSKSILPLFWMPHTHMGKYEIIEWNCFTISIFVAMVSLNAHTIFWHELEENQHFNTSWSFYCCCRRRRRRHILDVGKIYMKAFEQFFVAVYIRHTPISRCGSQLPFRQYSHSSW